MGVSRERSEHVTEAGTQPSCWHSRAPGARAACQRAEGEGFEPSGYRYPAVFKINSDVALTCCSASIEHRISGFRAPSVPVRDPLVPHDVAREWHGNPICIRLEGPVLARSGPMRSVSRSSIFLLLFPSFTPPVASVARMSPRHDPAEREAHLRRFGHVSAKYPHIVAQAYKGDLAAVESATDQQVAERVRAWELQQGVEPTDWVAIGDAERRAGSD
jgi:hypothetical protein